MTPASRASSPRCTSLVPMRHRLRQDVSVRRGRPRGRALPARCAVFGPGIGTGFKDGGFRNPQFRSQPRPKRQWAFAATQSGYGYDDS